MINWNKIHFWLSNLFQIYVGLNMLWPFLKWIYSLCYCYFIKSKVLILYVELLMIWEDFMKWISQCEKHGSSSLHHVQFWKCLVLRLLYTWCKMFRLSIGARMKPSVCGLFLLLVQLMETQSKKLSFSLLHSLCSIMCLKDSLYIWQMIIFTSNLGLSCLEIT